MSANASLTSHDAESPGPPPFSELFLLLTPPSSSVQGFHNGISQPGAFPYMYTYIPMQRDDSLISLFNLDFSQMLPAYVSISLLD